MKVKVEYVQEHLYIIIIFRIYRWYQTAVPIFNILISFEVMVERQKPNVAFGGFSTLLPPHANFEHSGSIEF